ncbi:beta strand repeat-containing protein [Asaia lannensis]|uniref:beta strand repeat-containing protein n=1 Tax=Asaia lannensis TaxID=415421 RepID=UPI0038737FC8
MLSADTLLSFAPAPNFNGAPPPLSAHLIDSSTVPVFGTTTGAMIAQGGIAQQGVDVTSNGGTTALSANSVDLNTTVTAVNDAPVATGSASLPAGTEDQTPPAQSVATLFGGSFNDSTDQQQNAANPTGSVANTLAGIAVTANTTPASEGVWRYSTDGGKTWNAVGTVSDSSALVLSADTLLSFAPAPNFNGAPPPLSAHLIDSSTVPVFGTTTGAMIAQGGIAQQGVDVTSNGGTTALSADSVDLNTAVTAVNDAPVATGSASLPAGTEDQTPPAQSVATLFGGSFNDSTDQQQNAANPTGSVANTLAGIAVTANTTPASEGVWRYSTDGGKTWNAVGTVSDSSALVLSADTLLSFAPAPNFNGAPPPLSAHLIDSSTVPVFGTTTGAMIAQGGIAQQGVDVTSNGGTTALSADSVDLNTAVTAVNDAPVATGSASLPAGTEDQTPPAQSVATLFGGSFNDSTDQQQNAANPTGSVANTLAGIAVTANTTPASEGVWRYSTDGGKTWNAVGTVSDSSALVLSADTLVSFAPAPNFNGAPPPLSAHLIDSSTVPVFGTTTGAMIAQGGIAQQGVDVTSNGGTTALSADSVDLNTAVTAVNDAPVATGSASLPAGTEDQTPPAQSVATLFGGSFNDSTDQQQNAANPTGSVANTLAGIAVTANTTPASEGVWRYSTDGGKTWNAVGTVSDSSALVLSADTLLSFAPAPNFNGAPPPLSAHLIDSSTVPVFGTTTGAMIAQGGIAQQGVDVTSNGGTTALSADSVDLNTTVTAVPDAPTATGTAFLPSIVQDGAPHGETVGALFGPSYGNAVDQQQTSINPTGSIAVPIAGVAIVSNPTPTSEGSWVYSTDGGQHWITISPSIDPAHALVLPKDVLLAFYPAPDFNGAPLPLDGRPIATNDAPITPGFTGNALHAVVQNVDLSNPDPNGAVALSAIPLNTTVEASLLRPQLTPGDNSIPVSDNGETVRDLFVGRYTDYRRDQQSALNPTGSTGAPFGGIVITANPTPPSEGTWRYSTDSGKSWVVIPADVSPQHAFVVPADAQIMFQGSGSYTGSATLEARLLRQNGAQGGFVDTGTGPFGQTSAQTLTLIGNTVAQDIGAHFGLPRLTTDTLREGFSASALAEPVVQAWLGPYERNVPQDASLGWLRGTDSQAFVMIQTQDAVSIASAFDSSDPVASLVLRATQKDGAPLPDWIVFDPLTGSFTVIAPAEAPEYVDLRVEARDQSLRTAESNIRITIGRDPMLELLGSVPDLATRAIAASGYSHGHRPFHRQVQHVVSGARPIPNRATKPRAHS